MRKTFVCIICPKGCELTVSQSEVTGNQCVRGIDFAQQEMTNPQRVLTTTVKLTTGELLPVRSKGTVKKKELTGLVGRLREVIVAPPVVIGGAIMLSVGENKVDIVAADNAL